MNVIKRAPGFALALALLAACGTKEPQAASQASPAPAADASPPGASAAGGMAGMPGMPAAASDTGATQAMRAHLRAVGTASADSLRAILPAHRQMVANMLARMNGEMRQMNMAADAAWTATVDSLRQDLVRMPDLSAAELKAAMPAHTARVTRLMEMHARMMQPR